MKVTTTSQTKSCARVSLMAMMVSGLMMIMNRQANDSSVTDVEWENNATKYERGLAFGRQLVH